MAAALWDDPSMASVARTALLKLRAGGVELVADSDLTIGVRAATPRAMGSEAVVATLLRAVQNSQPVSFHHRATPAAAPTTRHLEPWGVVTHRGRWYVVGHDLDRGETRTFRLSRVLEPVEVGTATFARPDEVDLRALVAAAATFADSRPSEAARVWVADGRGGGIRRAATSAEPLGRAGRPGAVVTLDEWSVDSLARQIVGLGDDAVAMGPQPLVDAVIAGLRGALTGADA